jgi:hypothetical protein
MKGPNLGARMFILAGHRYITLELLNTEYGFKSNCSDASEARIHRDGIRRTTFSYSGVLKTC